MLDKHMSELGPRVSSFEYDVYQATLGLRGKVFAGWSYDLYVQAGANDQTETQSGSASISRIEKLTFAPDGGKAICGGFNPFGVGSISAECAAYIAAGASNRASVDQTIIEASLNGPLLQLPAGELRAAFGVFYKKDEYRYSADPVATATVSPLDDRLDFLEFNGAPDIDANDENADLYVEASIPLLADRPGIRSLETVRRLPILEVRFGRRGGCIQGRPSVPTGRRTAIAQLVPARGACAERFRPVCAAGTDAALLWRRSLRGEQQTAQGT